MNIRNPILLDKIRSQPLLDAIEGMPCTLRISSFIPGHSCSSVSTVVPCHIRTPGTGISTKPSELACVAACFNCHNILDLRDTRWKEISDKYPSAVLWRLVQALLETHARLQMAGIIEVKGAERVKGGAV